MFCVTGQCIGHSERGSTVSCGMDAKSGQLVAITEWTLKWRHITRTGLDIEDKKHDDVEAAKYLKQVHIQLSFYCGKADLFPLRINANPMSI